MADHPRQTLREKIKDEIVNGSTQAGSRVYTNRVIPTQLDELPIILIYLKEESTEKEKELPRKRIATFSIEILQKIGDDLDDKLDEIAKEVEIIFQGDDFLDGLVNDMGFSNTSINLVQDGSRKLGSCILTYNCEYYTKTLV